MTRAWVRGAALLGAGLLAAALFLFGGPAATEAWLIPFQLALGVVVGATGALVIGHLLGEDWLSPLRPALDAVAGAAPLVALLALPLLVAPDRVYPWAADPSLAEGPRAIWFSRPVFLLRSVLLLGALVLAASLLRRPGRWRTAFALALWLPAAMLLAQDLVLSRDLGWFGSLQGTALVLNQVAAALALGVLAVLLRGGAPARPDLRGAERALLVLAMLVLWLWFTQFVVVWMADLPHEAAWYLRRGGGWAWLKLGLVTALGAAILLAIPPRAGPRRIGLVAALLVAQHLGQVAWLVRPDAPGAVPPPMLDMLALAVVLLAGIAWWGAAPWRPRRKGGDGPAAPVAGLQGRGGGRSAGPPSPTAREGWRPGG